MSLTDSSMMNTVRTRASWKPKVDADVVRALFYIFVVLALFVAAVATWGYPALIVGFLAAVPAMFCVLILITWG